jgi:hypothetical protein
MSYRLRRHNLHVGQREPMLFDFDIRRATFGGKTSVQMLSTGRGMLLRFRTCTKLNVWQTVYHYCLRGGKFSCKSDDRYVDYALP